MYIHAVSSSSLVIAENKGSYNSDTSINRWIQVLVDCPAWAAEAATEEEKTNNVLTYRLPDGLEVKPGDILSVPFGIQKVGGIAIRLLTQPPADLALEKISLDNIYHILDFFQC